MLDVGIIGVDQEWERYRPIMSKLRLPLRVQAVYDPVRARAERAAERLQAHVVTGLQAMAKRSDIQAILLFNADWMGHELLQLLLRSEKPVFVNPWFFAEPKTYQTLHEQAAQTGLPVMPTMWRRFTPATMRLRELIATVLGPPVAIRCSVDWSIPRPSVVECEELVGWLDYCRTLFRVYPSAVTQRTLDTHSQEITASFGAAPGQQLATLRIETSGNQSSSDEAHAAAADNLPAQPTDSSAIKRDSDEVPTRIEQIASGIRSWSTNQESRQLITRPESQALIEIECESGCAKVQSRVELSWQAKTEASEILGEVNAEVLVSERQEHEVMLDLFCRRVVGGLIPIADFNDLHHAAKLLVKAFEVKTTS